VPTFCASFRTLQGVEKTRLHLTADARKKCRWGKETKKTLTPVGFLNYGNPFLAENTKKLTPNNNNEKGREKGGSGWEEKEGVPFVGERARSWERN